MTRVVLDANVLVSGFPKPDGAPGKLIEQWLRRNFELVTSEHILAKAESTWSTKPYFQSRYSREQVQEALSLLRRRATIVTPVTAVRGIAPNAEDDVVLATAITGQVDCLVTGDVRFREKVESYQGVVLLSPREFLDLLERGNS